MKDKMAIVIDENNNTQLYFGDKRVDGVKYIKFEQSMHNPPSLTVECNPWVFFKDDLKKKKKTPTPSSMISPELDFAVDNEDYLSPDDEDMFD